MKTQLICLLAGVIGLALWAGPAKADFEPAKDEKKTEGRVGFESADEPESEEEPSEFGAGRRKPTPPTEGKKPRSKTSAKEDESETGASDKTVDDILAKADGDKEKQKFIRKLKSQFRKRDGFYVLATRERGFHPPAGDAQPNSRPESYETIEYLVLDGQVPAIEFVLEYLGEYNPPWEKKKPRSSRDDAGDQANAVPDPVRDYKMMQWFDEEEVAREFRTYQEQSLEQAKLEAARQLELRNGPKK